MRKLKIGMIRRMILQVRYRNIQDDCWPGKPLYAPAETRYPNILAEIEASGMYLQTPARHAGISEVVLAAVLEDNEDLTLNELGGLCGLYKCGMAYMAAGTLQVIDPATKKGEARRRALADLLKQADGAGIWRRAGESVLFRLNRGAPVTYAAYRQAMDDLKNAIYWQGEECKPRSVRRRTV